MKKYVLFLFFAFILFSGMRAQTAQHSKAQHVEPLQFTIDFSERYQTIRNFGASTGMRAIYLGEHWPQDVLSNMARWVFSKEVDSTGNPLGIGLSSFRFEIGAGSADNEKSGITRIWRKSESFLQADGSYDWTKSQGLVYWMRQAKNYNVPTLIGYTNSPPIYWTKNGYGYKLKRSMDANLKEDRYDDYGRYLATIAAHFEKEGLGFDYISPVNEPQWDWTGTPEKAKQEGSPWTNAQIKKVVTETNKAFEKKGVSTKILISEAGKIDYLYEKKPDDFASKASDQIKAFWDPASTHFIGDLDHLASVAGGHSYWLDESNSMIVSTRRQVRQEIKKVNPDLEFWQTEYSLLGNGYREKRKEVSEMDAALFIAKIIHYDLTVANASAWQFWATFNGAPRRGKPQRYTLVNASSPDNVRPTKNLWLLGHFSRFVEPGMQRISVARSDGLSLIAAGKKQMASAFYDKDTGKLTIVIINYQNNPKTVRMNLRNLGHLTNTKHANVDHLNIAFQRYETTGREEENLRKMKPVSIGNSFELPSRSVTTLTASFPN